MKVLNKALKLKTKKYLEFIDVTDRVEKIIKKAKIKAGFVNVFSKHTTLAIRINESEKGIFTDFSNFFNSLVSPKKYYCHNDLSIRTENIVCSTGATDCLNGHSHCQHLLLGTSESIPIIDGKMILGHWQRIFAIELDSERQREIIVHVIGEE